MIFANCKAVRKEGGRKRGARQSFSAVFLSEGVLTSKIFLKDIYYK
jgi:hypothetical protein